MTKQRAMRLAAKWAAGHVCTLREGEAQEYHELCFEALKQTQWISVEERLPEDNVRVLVFRDGCYALAEIYMYDYEGNPAWSYTGLGGDPTYWMPFTPKLTEEVGKEAIE